MLKTLVYISRAKKLMQQHELLVLLQEAREHNEKAGITGLLLYKDQSFIQVLEGKASELDSLYKDIQNDPRHFRVRTLYQDRLSERQFPNWSMGFHNLHDLNEHNTPGLSQFMTPDYDAEALRKNSGFAVELLYFFRANS